MIDFSTLIQLWFRQNSRSLPWRDTNNPFKIWLSEVILQQTRVSQGTNYYHSFTEKYPTVTSLAAASEDEILNLWQGLGYYSRARNMHKAAKYIVEHFDGNFPTTYTDIRSLPGVGDYTAAAVASIAFDLPYAVVDGNVYRVLSRYLAESTPIDTTEGKRLFAQKAQDLLDPKNPGTHNQALMELGSQICTPKNPDCMNCPIAGGCAAYSQRNPEGFPVKSRKTAVRNRFFHYFIVTDGKSLLLKKRPEGDIWQGLYDFPLVEKEKDEALNKSDYAIWAPVKLIRDGKLSHILTHQRLSATFTVLEMHTIPPTDEYICVDINSLEAYPMPILLIRYIENSKYLGDR